MASPHRLATAAGEQVLAEGGSAVDAAIATAAVLAVVAPHQCGIGGDAVALVAEPGADIACYQGAGRSAAAVDVDAVRQLGHGPMPVFGPHSVTVPGAVSAWAAMHADAGRLPWSGLFDDATTLAADGFGVGRGLSEAIADSSGRVRVDPGLHALLTLDDKPLTLGDHLQQPALAQTLTALASAGPDALYRGPVGASLVEHLRSLGSSLSVEDLTGHLCERPEPIESAWRGARLWTAPPPSQGVVLFHILALLDELGGSNDLLGSDADLLAGVFAASTTFREERLADPRASPVDVSHGVHPDDIARTAGQIREGARPAAAPSPSPRRPDGDTVAVVAADAEGGFVSLIFSLFYSFGSGICDPSTGVVLHNRGAGFTLDAGSPNCLAPSRRPAHSLMPLLLADDEGVFAAHGTMGGYGQPQIHAQLLLRLDAGQTPTEAVTAPRWVVGRPDDDGGLQIEVERSAPGVVQDSLGRAGLPVQLLADLDSEVGHAQLVRRDASGALLVATDPRAEG